eukprot:5458791-Ditylum_brightwellii.AAC.1
MEGAISLTFNQAARNFAYQTIPHTDPSFGAQSMPSSNRLSLVGGNFSMDAFPKCGQTSKTSTSETSNFTLDAQMEHPGLN